MRWPPRGASAAAAWISRVDLPMPGSPAMSRTEPRTKPPPVTRSSSGMPDGRRGASWVSPTSGSSLKGRPCEAPGRGRQGGPATPPVPSPSSTHGIPLAAALAFALPAGRSCAAVLADVGQVAAGHGDPWRIGGVSEVEP